MSATATTRPHDPVIDRPPGAAVALRWAVTDMFTLCARGLRHVWRQPQLLLFSTVQPVMFVLLFVFVFGGAIGPSLPPGLDYLSFLLPGILVQSTAFRSTQTAVGLAEDLNRGVVDRFRSMPMARSAVMTGRTATDLVRGAFVLVLMVGVGYLLGFRFQAGFLSALGALGIVLAFGYALSWIFALVALTVRGAEAAQAAGFLAVFPLVFASSVFVPVQTMPGWLQGFAQVNPVTVTADAARALSLGGPVVEPLWQSLAWTAALLVVFVPLSVWRYRRMT
jgi:ABC transporter DrrB family efflux protein